MKDEIWKDIENCTNYQVSNYGRIKSKRRKFIKERILVTGPGKNTGKYHTCSIYDNNGKHLTPYVHRLVAKHFIPNPENKPEVNHKDRNHSNNHVSNLVW